ncbi:MAG TPA: zinc-ribbon domain-containing protein [Candidatus Binataceae bacterium]|nr:zinc-ribbon domain-containing protein [Candidatus Binataceae bacterium]
MTCSRCGNDNPAGAKFCGNCAAPLANLCANCGAENPPQFKFCGQCASALGASAPARQSSTPIAVQAADSSTVPLEGERKTVTALFADIKGSTELEQDLDPEEARAIIDPALKLMIDAVRRYDGYIVQSTGDGIFAIFGAPVAHEDHPQRALYAALRMQEEIRRYAEKLRVEYNAERPHSSLGYRSPEEFVTAIESNQRSAAGAMHGAPTADPEPTTLSGPPSNRVEGGPES